MITDTTSVVPEDLAVVCGLQTLGTENGNSCLSCRELAFRDQAATSFVGEDGPVIGIWLAISMFA